MSVWKMRKVFLLVFVFCFTKMTGKCVCSCCIIKLGGYKNVM